MTEGYDNGYHHDRLVEERFRRGSLIAVVAVVSVFLAVLATQQIWLAVGGFFGLVLFLAAFLKPELALLVVTVAAPLLIYGARLGFGAEPVKSITLIPGTGITPVNAMMILLVLGSWAHRFSPNRPAAEATEVDRPLLLFLAWSGFSIVVGTGLWSFDPAGMGEWLQFAAGIVTYWVVRRRWYSKSLAVFAVWLVLALVLYQAFMVFVQYRNPALNTSVFDWELKRQITGTFPPGNSNDTGTYLSCYGLVAMGLFMIMRRSPWRWVALLVFIAAGGAMFMTYSRAALLGMVAGGMFMALYKQRKYVLPLIAVIALLPSLLPGAIADRFTNTSDASAESRKDLWKRAAVVTLKNPIFGIGWRAYSKSQANQGYKLRDPHNMYLLVSSEQGLPGIALFLGILFGAGAVLTRTLRQKHTAFTEGLALGLFGALICFAVNNVFGSRMIYLYVIQHFFLLLGLLVVLAQAPQREDGEIAVAEEPEPEPVASGQPSPWRYRSYV